MTPPTPDAGYLHAAQHGGETLPSTCESPRSAPPWAGMFPADLLLARCHQKKSPTGREVSSAFIWKTVQLKPSAAAGAVMPSFCVYFPSLPQSAPETQEAHILRDSLCAPQQQIVCEQTDSHRCLYGVFSTNRPTACSRLRRLKP